MSAKQGNYFAANGINVATNDWWFTQMGTRTGLYQEESTGMANHSMYRLTDLLAVGAALEKLDSTFTLDKLNELSKVGSNDPKGSLEGVLDSLRRVLVGPNVERLQISDAADSDPSRVTFQATLAALQATAQYKALAGKVTIESLVDKSAAGIVGLAKDGDIDALAYRYALKAGNPFAVLTAPSFYAQHNQNGELDLYDTNTSQGELTDQYLTDRAKYLTLKLDLNTRDIPTSLTQPYEDVLASEWQYFKDYASEEEFVLGNPPNGQADRRILLFGSDAQAGEVLTGQDRDDHLYGGAGDDTLGGGKGDDYLEGGTGNDTYRINIGDGNDIILDTDAQGSITRDGHTLDGGQYIGPNQWQDAQGNVYSLSGTSSGRFDLLVGMGSEQIIVKDHHDGELGIRLVGEVAPTPFSQSGNGIVVIGDRMPYQMPWDYWSWVNNPTWPYLFSSSGNIVRTNIPMPFYADKIFDTSGDDNIDAGHGFNVIFAYNGGNNTIASGLNDDYILGGAGRDRIYSGGMTDTIDSSSGDDIVYGEEGRDVIQGGSGMDFLSGGADGDAIEGGNGNDQIYGENSMTWAHALVDSGTSSAASGELLAGGTGDDLVVGSDTADALLGGEGKDSIAAREGNDIVFGDAGLVFIAPPLSEFDAIISAVYWPLGPDLNVRSPFSTAPMLNIRFERSVTGSGSATQYTVKLSSLSNPEAPRDNWMTPATTGDDDQLYGGSGDDWIFGEFGRDTLSGGTGNDYLDGGLGNDTYLFAKGDGQDVIADKDATTGNADRILMTDSLPDDVTVSRDATNLYIKIKNATDKVTLSQWFSSGNQIEQIVFSNNVTWDTTQMAAASQVPTTGPDYLVGDAGANPLAGLGGDDIYVVDNAADVVTEAVDAGTDTVLSSTAYVLPNNVENLTLTGTSTISGTGNALNNVVIGNAGSNALDGGIGADTLIGGAGDDILTGDVPGFTNNKVLLNSLVIQARGTPVDNGFPAMEVWIDGTRVQTVTVSATSATAYTVSLPAGILASEVALVFTNDAYNAQTGQDRNLFIDQIVVNGQVIKGNTPGVLLDYGTGIAARDDFNTYAGGGALYNNGALRFGLTGSDLLDGGSGADTLRGGIGNDVYVVDSAGDKIEEGLSAGHDLVKSSVSYTLADNVEDLNLMGTANLNGTGNAGQNMLVGNSGANRLDGGQGRDMLVGGLGDDTYVVDNVGDSIWENANAGTDTVESSIAWTLQANVENLTLNAVTAATLAGNDLANSITGNAGNDTLSGGLGSDTLNGGAGNDILQGDPTGVVESVAVNSLVINARGTAVDNLFPSMEVWIDGVKTQTLTVDALNYTAYAITVPAGTLAKEIAVVFANDAYNAQTGQDRNLYVDQIVVNGQVIKGNAAGVLLDFGTGTGAVDDFNTYAGYSTLSSNGAMRFRLVGSDLLDGGSGADTLRGGIGNDVYVVDNVADVIEESVTAGHDLVKSSVSYTLADNVEDLNLMGTANLGGTGNAGQNMLVGNSGANRLDGGQGRDMLVGSLGDDTYVVDNVGDSIWENANAGTDTVESSISWTLQANTEALVLTGTSAINGTGNALNNLLRGNAGNNVLNGNAGNDILEGGDGNDTLTDTAGTAFFNGGAGTDTITGGASAELFLGGLGNDTYTTGAGNDVILFNKGDGQDTFATGGTGSDTLSLGGSGLAYSDLSFSKSTNDLVLKMGTTDQITFKNWYAATPSKPVVNLQVIAEAMADFAAGGANPLLDQKVETFNFAGLAGAFDAARTATPTLTAWALTNALTSFQLAGSDSAALGGDLAFQYGKNGTLAGIGLAAAQDVIGNAGFGTSAHTLRPLAGLQTGAVRLS